MGRMKLTQEQEGLIREWAAHGLSLGQIQENLKAEGVLATYMEVRFLVDDLGVEIHEKPQPKTVPPIGASGPSTDETSSPPTRQAQGLAAEGLRPENNEANETNGVTVSIDAVVRPGTVVSGEVNFTDGTKAGWALDQYGRLGLMNAPEGYQPSVTDLEDFQKQLRAMIEARGGM